MCGQQMQPPEPLKWIQLQSSNRSVGLMAEAFHLSFKHLLSILQWDASRMMIHGATFWAMLLGNFGKYCRQRATRWDTGPSTTDLKYPDRNLLPILNGKVPKQHCSKKLPGKIAQKVALCIISIRCERLWKHLYLCSLHGAVAGLHRERSLAQALKLRE